jgi:sugar lactone lactonase YvrE
MQLILKLLIFSFLLNILSNCSSSQQPEVTTQNSIKSMDSIKAVLAYKIKAQLGEGAFWNHQTQEFFWIDIEGKQFHIYDPKTKNNRSFTTPSRIGTVVPSGEQEALIALEDGMYTINTQSGEIKLFSAVEADRPDNRFNDGKCDPAGRLWVGSMGLGQGSKKANLYKIDGEGTATKMLDSITISNGIVWTRDHRTMYYIDTPTSKIMAYDYDKISGTISNEKVAVEVPKSLGYPDGMAIDENDMLWVGLWNGNGVANFNPITGKLISKIEVPAHNVTACAFGGTNLDTLFITTASVDMTPEEQIAFPDAGSVFLAVPGVRGVESHHFLKE